MVIPVRMDQQLRKVIANGTSVILTPMEFEMFRLVYASRNRGGISAADIFHAQYYFDPSGGPDFGKRVIHQRRCQINRKLKPLGLLINDPGKFNNYLLKGINE